MPRSGSEARRPGVGRRLARLVVAASVGLTGLAVDAATTAGPVSAATTDTVTVTGHGWGHGRGLGQYGSLGYAVDNGWNYQTILDHFYGGTTPGTQANDVIGVQLTAWTAKTIAVTSSAPFRVGQWGAPGSGFGLVGGGSLAEVFFSSGKWYMQTWEGGCDRTAGPYGPYEIGDPSIEPSAPGDTAGSLLTLCGASERRTYRGSLHIATVSGITNLVNDVPMESYLRGVVPRESPASWGSSGATDPVTGKPWGFHALAAQAVAARSYASAENRSPGNWKTCDTTSCQVYGGVAAEDSRSNEAVDATAGKVLTYQGKPAFTQFGSSSGGWTAAGSMPYLVAKADKYDGFAGNPVHSWTTSVAATAVERAWPAVGKLRRVLVTKRDGNGEWSGRVESMTLQGSRSDVEVSGYSFRSALGLRTNWFRLGSASTPAPSPQPAPQPTPVSDPASARTSPINARWKAIGGSSSVVRNPVSKAYAVAGGRARRYERGRIFYLRGVGAHELYGKVVRAYLRRGGPSSRLGFPTTAPRRFSRGVSARFEHGVLRVYRSGKVKLSYS
ncbi:MAG: SpoIID/LytB domain-containing protein [Marmoricola sp.]